MLKNCCPGIRLHLFHKPSGLILWIYAGRGLKQPDPPLIFSHAERSVMHWDHIFAHVWTFPVALTLPTLLGMTAVPFLSYLVPSFTQRLMHACPVINFASRLTSASLILNCCSRSGRRAVVRHDETSKKCSWEKNSRPFSTPNLRSFFPIQ